MQFPSSGGSFRRAPDGSLQSAAEAGRTEPPAVDLPADPPPPATPPVAKSRTKKEA